METAESQTQASHEFPPPLGISPEADEKKKLLDAAEKLMPLDTRIRIDDTAGLTPLDIAARVRRMRSQYLDLAVFVIDFIQIIQPDHASQGRTENRNTELTRIAAALKRLANRSRSP